MTIRSFCASKEPNIEPCVGGCAGQAFRRGPKWVSRCTIAWTDQWKLTSAIGDKMNHNGLLWASLLCATLMLRVSPARAEENPDAYWVAVGAVQYLVLIRDAQLDNPKVLQIVDIAVDANLAWIRKYRALNATIADDNITKVFAALDRSWHKKAPSEDVRPTTDEAIDAWLTTRRQNMDLVHQVIKGSLSRD
jgi:hypothetical protein